MLDIFKKLLGSKSVRDIKTISPLVETALEFGEAISKISNDELRAKTIEFKQRIQDRIVAKQQEIAELRAKLNSDEIPIDAKEDLYKDLDKLEKDEYDLIQDELNVILPEAFAVVKETARRFVEHEWVEVTATEMDRELATRRTSIEIAGDIARYRNSWIAGGNTIRWDMVHYDCQLIGRVEDISTQRLDHSHQNAGDESPFDAAEPAQGNNTETDQSECSPHERIDVVVGREQCPGHADQFGGDRRSEPGDVELDSGRGRNLLQREARHVQRRALHDHRRECAGSDLHRHGFDQRRDLLLRRRLHQLRW